MGDLDVSFLLTDPDFTETIVLERRTASVGTDGRTSIAAKRTTVIASVQRPGNEELALVPQATQLRDVIAVYYGGALHPMAAEGYGDVVIVGGRRYRVHALVEDWTRFGGTGWCRAVAVAEVASA